MKVEISCFPPQVIVSDSLSHAHRRQQLLARFYDFGIQLFSLQLVQHRFKFKVLLRWLCTLLAIVTSNACWAAEIHSIEMPEGQVLKAEITAGPIDIHRKYKSMEGPFVNQDLRIGELLKSQKIEVPESLVYFVEESSQGPAMMGGKADSSAAPSRELKGLVPRTGATRELYWFKGIKVEVLDENDSLMPTAEFICHFNLDIDPAKRTELFPTSEGSGNPRLVSLTQGQTEFYFPEGYGVPVASDEVWRFGFQAANRTTDSHRRVKHRCTVYFIRDSQLSKPIKALSWYVPYCSVVVDRYNPESEAHHGGPSCLPTLPGVVAPNQGSHLSVHKDSRGRRVSGHFVVPPGRHDYSEPIQEERDPGFAKKDRTIHAIWTHIHPLCTQTSLVECDGSARRKVYQAHIETKTTGGLEIKNIETITSKEGIPLSAGKHYAIEGTYLNDTGIAQDSMISHGIFFYDDTFSKPDWVKLAVAEDATPEAAVNHGNHPKELKTLRLFNPEVDGPLISGNRIMELETSVGKIHLVLEPSLAPMHATQLHKLLVTGAYNGTRFVNYQQNFQIQLGDTTSQPPRMTCRLSLETSSARDLPSSHQRWALSMARDTDPDSAVSSFCILLNSAPHLDGQFTVFGHIVPDDITVKSISRLTEEWPQKKAFIINAREIGSYFQLSKR